MGAGAPQAAFHAGALERQKQRLAQAYNLLLLIVPTLLRGMQVKMLQRPRAVEENGAMVPPVRCLTKYEASPEQLRLITQEH